MSYAAIYISDFMVQAMVRSEVALRGRAVVVVEGTAPLWHVVGANPQALRLGIELGMTKSQAEQFAG